MMSQRSEHSHDLIVIGGGPGGLVTASVAGQLGLDVILIDRGPRLGGDCLHTGCVPSKALLHAAGTAHGIRKAGRLGISAPGVTADLEAVLERVHGVIETLHEHDDPDRFRGFGVDVRFGDARFVDPHHVEVNGERLRGRRFVIATGSAPALPPAPGLADAAPHTNETVFRSRPLPSTLAVIGGGPIGVEMAQAFQRLGSAVTLLEAGPRILPRDDADAAAELTEILAREGVDVRTGAALQRVSTGADGRRHLEIADAGSFAVDEILVAAGRRAQVDGIGLENAGVVVDQGRIRVDARQRTSRKHIFACGDCCGPFAFTHMAEYQAGIIIANAIFRVPRKADYRAVPWVTYTTPELGQVGPTEAEARDRGLSIEVAHFRMRDVDRAVAEDATDGFVKIIVHRGRIIGGTILSANGGELLHELVLAVHAKLRVGALSAAIHAYPTLSQVLRRAVNTLYAPRLYSARTRRLVRWIHRLLP